jgi:hypothetical protein
VSGRCGRNISTLAAFKIYAVLFQIFHDSSGFIQSLRKKEAVRILRPVRPLWL